LCVYLGVRVGDGVRQALETSPSSSSHFEARWYV